jgi:hypothetical protein
MAAIENSVQINRSPEEVFDFGVDMRNELKWNPDVELMEKITEGAIALGAKFRAKWKQSPIVICECTKFDRPRAWSYHNGGPIEVDLDISVAPRDGGSLLVSRFDAKPHGWFRVIFPVFVQIMKRAEKANMAYVKKAMEGGAN